MNPLSIESALRSALAPSFSGTTIYLGTDYEELTPESLNLIVACTQTTHETGGIYLADVLIKISAPALLGTTSLAQFQGILDTTYGILTTAFLSTAWTTVVPAFAGIWVKGTKMSTSKELWVAEIETSLGVTL